MRVIPRAHRDSAHLVTEARRSRSEDISYRERRYLIMMGIRVVCFGLGVLLFVRGAGWVAAIPAVAAIVIPYFAVVFANGGREPDRTRRFRPYEPNLPVPYSEHQQATPGPAGDRDGGQAWPGGNSAGHGPETE